MSDVFFRELDLGEPAYRLDLRSADVEAMTPGIREAVERERPQWVLVYGDTNSTVAGLHAAGGTPVAHVEAGLRSFDLSMPEERNRIEVDASAALLLCPDDGSAGRLARLVDAVAATGRRFVFPVHPRTRQVLEAASIRLPDAVEAVEPLGYLEMLATVAGARTVVTDSGGLQKEAYWLRVPCVTLRSTTEWTDTVRVGANRLVDPDAPAGLASALAEARFPPDAPQLYGDGHAAGRIAAHLYI